MPLFTEEESAAVVKAAGAFGEQAQTMLATIEQSALQQRIFDPVRRANAAKASTNYIALDPNLARSQSGRLVYASGNRVADAVMTEIVQSLEVLEPGRLKGKIPPGKDLKVVDAQELAGPSSPRDGLLGALEASITAIAHYERGMGGRPLYATVLAPTLAAAPNCSSVALSARQIRAATH